MTAWHGKRDKAMEFKKKHFQDDANTCMAFFNGPYNFMYSSKYRNSGGSAFNVSGGAGGDTPDMTFQMTVNKVAEMVQLFGPVLYHRNPIRQVNPRKPPMVPIELFGDPQDPMVQQQYLPLLMANRQIKGQDLARAKLLEFYLNYTPNALDLKTHSRDAIDEAIIKGMGCLAGGTRIYAQIDGRHTVIRIRDLERAKGEVKLWNGEKWTRMVAIRSKPRKGDELRLILASGEEINCTRDHGWPVQGKGNLRADALQVGDCLGHVKIQDNKAASPLHAPDVLGWFLGVFLGDGHIPKDKKDIRIEIAGHVEELDRHERLERIVKEYGGTIKWRGVEGTKKWDCTISCRALVAYVRQFILGDNAFTKHLSTSCWERSDAFLNHLLDGYLDSDGHWVEDEEIWRLGFCHNSKLAKSLRTLCARLGKRLTLKLQSQHVNEKWQRYYKGAIRTKPMASNSKNLGEIVAIKEADWRCDRYYDIQVHDEPNTYALASGVVTHNCLWTELYTPPGSQMRFAGSFYGSVDDLILDPDAETIDDCKWIMRRCVEPVWKVEEDYGLAPGTIRGNLESNGQQGLVAADPDGDYRRKQGLTNDLLVYYKLFSKMGMGAKLSGVTSTLRQELDQYGKFVYLVLCDTCHYPLNLPPEVTEANDDQEIRRRIEWPTPYWADDGWPFAELSFHRVPKQLYPMSHLKPGMGELMFINWAYSFIAGKIKTSCRDFVVVAKSLNEEFKNTILSGKDYELIEIEKAHGTISELVQFLQHPQFNGDIWKVIQAVEQNFEKRVGLTELMYGTSANQLRSASEAQVKSDQLRVRPDDMANKVEDMMGKVARQEALCARWHLTGQDIQPVMGPIASQFWDQLVVPSDPNMVLHQLEYRIEAGSAKKPNRDRDANNMQQALQNLFQPMMGYAQASGDYDAINTLIADWAKSIDLDPEKYLFKPPPMLPPPGGPGAPAGGPPGPAQPARPGAAA